MAAHAMVVSGVRRRIGNGQTTLIWGHPWLRDNPSPLIQTEMPQQLREARVAGLIDSQTHTWDPHILSDLFIPEDVERINMIPVSPEYEDSWYWMSDPKGTYTVKNAYRHIVGDYENNPANFDKWIAMWKIKVPPKWKTFLWRAIYSFTTWLKGVMTVLTEEQIRLMVAVLYYIWRTRNSAVWKGSMMRPTQLVKAATVALQAYGTAHVGRTNPTPATDHVNGPGGGGLRCYVDAGFRHDTGEATYGMVIIAPDGSFVAARNGKLPVCFSPLMAEAQAYKEALSWLLERDTTSVSLLTDCMELAAIFRHHHTPIHSYVGVTVDQCRTFMSFFNRITLDYISRQVNLHAHALATLAFTQDQAMYWDAIPPDTISTLIH
ncbi:PREDICTED: uncharacterized protein LOC109181184 [Ipomoea nil]|uniref:uncharacterized protein LOC109181184 n=1 Tax=Ipomoea nil TaxID=35883 RepID=UPI00090098F7|nr:PREDICTED: uncharacterized protein LOC109181184 [Ipomoea nil]